MNIEILEDENCAMVEIHKDGEAIFIGNYWDLPTDPKALSQLLKSLGINHTVKPYNYK
jgi:hypothetical protein